MATAAPDQEEARLSALEALNVLSTPEDRFDRVTRHPDQAAVDVAVTAAATAERTVQGVVDRLVAPARSAHRDDDVTVVALRRVR